MNLLQKINWCLRFVTVRSRTFYWKRIFRKFGTHSTVFGRISVISPENIELGNSSTLNEGVLLNARGLIKIGNDVHISPYCIINTGELEYKNTGQARLHNSRPVTIKDGVWIGSGAIINPGVIIGENSVIGAGAVVTENIPSNVIAVGVPAKVLKSIYD